MIVRLANSAVWCTSHSPERCDGGPDLSLSGKPTGQGRRVSQIPTLSQVTGRLYLGPFGAFTLHFVASSTLFERRPPVSADGAKLEDSANALRPSFLI
jgi:hypothetical protein